MSIASFNELNLAPAICRALVEENYTTPTPIQAGAIPHLLQRLDLLGCAQTGTGKTAAFALPILHYLETNPTKARPNCPQVLVLSPTRELAVQIAESFSNYGRHVRFRQTVVYGGVSQVGQVRNLQRGVHVVIATPGRLLDLIEQGHLRLDDVQTFVLDEADRMLDMGFMPDLKRIIKKLPESRQSLFFSATMPPKVAELAASLLREPVRVSVTPESSTVELIEQRVMFVPSSKKQALLTHLMAAEGYRRVLVFSRTKHGADKLAQHLCKSGMHADAIHGNKSQNARERTLARFRAGGLRVLVATDVAARGIDVDGISHVINFDLPHDPESYVHRIGRTGRAGATGEAVLFCDPSERGGLRAIERLTKRSIPVDADHPFQVVGGGHSRPAGGNFRRGGDAPRSTGERSAGERSAGERSAAPRGDGQFEQSGEGAPSQGEGRPANAGGKRPFGGGRGPRPFGTARRADGPQAKKKRRPAGAGPGRKKFARKSSGSSAQS